MKVKRLIQATMLAGLLAILTAAPGAAASHTVMPDGGYVLQGGWCRVC